MSQPTAYSIVGGHVILPDGLATKCVNVKDGRIESLTDTPAYAARTDASRLYVSPGFVDIHVHGGGGADTMDATPEALRTLCRFHALGGTTSLLATTASSSMEALLRALACAREMVGTDTDGAEILGVHCEGPYFARRMRGCHLPEFVRDPDPREYDEMLESGVIRTMTLAPELPGALDLIRRLRQAGVVACAGHSLATYEEVMLAVEAGLAHVTHIYSAMSSVRKHGPYRVAGLLEAALVCDRLTAEMISDGLHLPPPLMKLVLRAKGIERICLVTDAMRGAGMPDGEYAFGPSDGQLGRVAEGESVAVMPDRSGFASSASTSLRCVRKALASSGLPVHEAVALMSLNPARIIGVADRKGSLEPGKDADILLLDQELRLEAVIVRGQAVHPDW